MNCSDPNSHFYGEMYSEIVETGLVGLMYKFGHRALEFGIRDSGKILEVGAGKGQHLKYVTAFDEYFLSDLRPQYLPILTGRNIHTILEPVNCQKLPFEDNTFDRLVATCLLIHLPDPLPFLKECKRVVKDKGIISLYVACEPSILLRIGQFLFTRRKEKKNSDLGSLRHYLDHVSNYPRTKVFLFNTFKKANISIIRYPFPFLTWNLNLFSIVRVINRK
jgi:phosphatidylethanolamine/phosphatidyl-N-methylethanolamine N-methyltransferase